MVLEEYLKKFSIDETYFKILDIDEEDLYNSNAIRYLTDGISKNNFYNILYWTKLEKYIEHNYEDLIQGIFVRPDNWANIHFKSRLNISIEDTFHLELKRVPSDNQVRVFLNIDYDNGLFDYLLENKPKIEKIIGQPLIMGDFGKTQVNFQISLSKTFFNMDNFENWDEIIKWQGDTVKKFYDCFVEQIENYNDYVLDSKESLKNNEIEIIRIKFEGRRNKYLTKLNLHIII